MWGRGRKGKRCRRGREEEGGRDVGARGREGERCRIGKEEERGRDKKEMREGEIRRW
jgi:hypothetical protein